MTHLPKSKIKTNKIVANKNFGIYLTIIFVFASLLLIFLQFDFTKNMQTALQGNKRLVYELQNSNRLREVDRDILGVESRIRAAIATDDTTHLEGIDSKILQVNAYLDSINPNNQISKEGPYIERLRTLALDKIRIKNALLTRYHIYQNMNDTSFIANPYARRISDEISHLTNEIFDIRHEQIMSLTTSNIDNGQSAMRYGKLLVIFMFLSGSLIIYFIFQQFKRQNKLITQLNISEKTAKDALHIKENFLANMSHEIRTPLNSILGFTGLLKKHPPEKEANIFVNTIDKAAENLMEIVNDILDISKIEAGMLRIVQAPFDIRGLAQSVEILFQQKAKEKGLQLNFIVDPTIPKLLNGDATRLTQILVNLIGNAIKFSRNGAIEIHFNNKEIHGETIQFEVIVLDHGIGIEKEKLPTIFERFNQVEDSIIRNYGGSGLGLTIVKQLVELQNGSINVDSSPGIGTTFSIIIPYKIVENSSIENSEEHYSRETKTSIIQNIKILVVDDNEMNQQLMLHVLKQWNIDPTIVSNGQQAIETLSMQSFDLILMDMQMPIMDGYTTAQFIRNELHINTPIIAMTAHAFSGEREKCISFGMNDYISKPIHEVSLKNLISNYTSPINTLNTLSNKLELRGDFKVINLQYMKEISGGNKDYEIQVTQLFIDLIPKDLDNLTNELALYNLDAIHKIAHNMKTSISIMGLQSLLQDDLNYLETTTTASNFETIIDRIKTICNSAIVEAKSYLQQIKNSLIKKN